MKQKMITFVSALVLFLAPSEPLRAQQSMLDGNPVWVYQQEIEWEIKNFPDNVKGFNSSEEEPLYLFHIYFIDGDTTIQNRVYKKLYHEYKSGNGRYIGTNGAELVTPLREEGNKIFAPRSFYQQRWGDAEWYYEMEGSTNDEIVIYDFDALKEGKVSIEQKGQIFSHFIVNEFDNKLIDKTSCQVYQFGTDKQALQITAGIGCTKNNVLLFAPFADDNYMVPDEVEAEMEIRTRTQMYGEPGLYPTESGDSATSPRWLVCTLDGFETFHFGYVIYDANQLSLDDTWVRTTEDGKMMVTVKKGSSFAFLCFYVQNGKIIYQETSEFNLGYGFVKDYLAYHINEEEEMVDLGLSVKWSTHNVGATSATDFGQYFCWGDTTGIDWCEYDEMVPYSGHYLEFEKRLQNHIAKTKYDAAYRLQGKNWRMPTPAEYQELINRCTCVQLDVNGVDGYLLTGPNGNTLFLPKAGVMQQTRKGMTSSDAFYNAAVYWTETLIEDSRGRKNDVDVYYNNQRNIENRYNNDYYPLKALPIRAVYDESGDKWLSVNEYLYYERSDLIEWGWNGNDVVIPTVEACNDFITRHQELFGQSEDQDQMIRQLLRDNYRQYVADRLETYKSRAVDCYEGSDGKTLYFVDQIDDDLLNVFDTKLGQIDLMAAINLEEDNSGNGFYTKNCTYTMEDIDPKFGVPGNQYLHAIPMTAAANPYIAFNLPSLLANTNYTIRITMAPEALDSVAPQPNKFRINMFIKGIEGDWPKTRNFVCKNPLDPTGKEQNFTSSADTLTVYDIPLTLTYSTDVMVQLQAYVSSADAKTYSRHLRIANIEVINNGKDVVPMIAEQKTWKVGWFLTSTSTKPHMVTTYYFEGDTIVNDQKAKRMLCDKATMWNISSGEYVGAWYEQNKQVYCAFPGEDQFRRLYDFTSNVNERFYVYNPLTGNEEEGYLKALQTGRNNSFKGISHVVSQYPNATSWSTAWLEGVGGLGAPTDNIGYETTGYKLFSCQVGDEVIYLNEQLSDVLELDTDGPNKVKKRRFDFNHTVKTQPKVPVRRVEEVPLYGEYSDELLDIKLDLLNEAYGVQIINNKTDEVIYSKTINAENIVALNIDISAYPEGQYTISIENANEVFTGQFDTTATAIKEIQNTPHRGGDGGGLFNLQGQRIKTLQKGLNIVDGQKIYVK